MSGKKLVRKATEEGESRVVTRDHIGELFDLCTSRKRTDLIEKIADPDLLREFLSLLEKRVEFHKKEIRYLSEISRMMVSRARAVLEAIDDRGGFDGK